MNNEWDDLEVVCNKLENMLYFLEFITSGECIDMELFNLMSGE